MENMPQSDNKRYTVHQKGEAKNRVYSGFHGLILAQIFSSNLNS